jgi:predicted RecB family nuclease
MQQTPAGLVLSPTDLTKHLACAHLTTLDLAAANHELPVPTLEDEALDLIFRLGLEHEHAYLQTLRERHGEVVEIPAGLELDEQVRLTVEAMRAGAEVVYQATFLHAGQRGHADFLLRADRPSVLGDWSYDVADTKLARRMKVAALLQMAEYGRHLQRIQGSPPEWLTVVTGDGEERPYRYADCAAYAERATTQLRRAVTQPEPTVPQPNPHCAQCRWSPRCEAGWRRADHLSLVAFMRTDHRLALEAAGVPTVEALAAADPADLPADIGEPARIRLQAQAALQVQERRDGDPHVELLESTPGLGLLRLPEPSPGDVYLDFEGDPYAAGGEGREYLAGLWTRDGGFLSWWAHDHDEERALTRDLLADLCARLDADPGMHVYHYAPYERSALARLTQRHGVGEAELDRLLRGQVLVDLYAVVRQGLRISKGSYSIKKMEAFYWGGIRGSGDQPDDVADALASVVAYERWLVDRDPTVLPKIEAYNQDDCRSTHDLHGWLEERRAELERRDGPQPRPGPPEVPSAELTDAEQAEADLVEQLLAADEPLLAGLVGWHRRELRPQWWEFFRTETLSDDELVRDGTAIGQVGPPVLVDTVKKSNVYRYAFPPQDCKVGDAVTDVDTHEDAGTVHRLSAEEGWIELRRKQGRAPATPRGFGPTMPFLTGEQQGSIRRAAADVLAGVRSPLLDRVVPTDLAPRPGESASEVALRVGRDLDGRVLAVQGPPGAGKTHTGAELIRQLLDAGRTVGVTANSHAVIGNLLREVDRPALQRCSPDQHCGHDQVDAAKSNGAVKDALATGQHRLVGGTAWLWATEAMQRSVDVLVIDEAGQLSLANALAVSRAASGLVLLGDPQQLAQPGRGVHPGGAGVSALEHLLDGAATMPPARGVFLDRTWRMHPDLTRVVSGLMYDDRLTSVEETARQALHVDGWPASGVRWEPVEHRGNEAASTEEADRVAALVGELLTGTWVDCDGDERHTTLADVLVVAPYNAHVARLRSRLPDGARVGTVDKFQGQEAAVVIYTMASSSADDAPRGVSFLYDLHRLNVAISRARCVAAVVGSPALLDAPANGPDNLRRVNGLLRVASADLVRYGGAGEVLP